jgi:type I restriction enzyme M protein
MNLYLHEIETFSVKVGDTLWNPRLRDESGALTRFDVVIANPPFSIGKETPWGHERWAEDPWGRSEYGVPPKGRADFAFVEHMLVSMKATTGRLAVVMSHGVLFRGAEQHIRRKLLQVGLIDMVIGLPPNVFYGTPLAACLLVCRPQPAGQASSVLFVDASSRFAKGKPKNVMSPDDVAAVVAAGKPDAAPSLDGVLARRVPVSEIEQHEWDLNIPRYLESADEGFMDLASAMQMYRDAGLASEAASTKLTATLKAAHFDV